VERETDGGGRGERVLAEWREEQAHMLRIDRDLIHGVCEERDADMERVWRGES